MPAHYPVKNRTNTRRVTRERADLATLRATIGGAMNRQDRLVGYIPAKLVIKLGRLV